MLYFWLKKGAKEKIEDLQKQGLLGTSLDVGTDEKSGKNRISVYEDPFNPTTDLPEIPEELIEKVTVKDYHIYRGFRTEGIYRHEGAVLMLKNYHEVVHDYTSGQIERDEYQNISISAPSVKALKTIYTMVRQGKLKPDEDWEQYSPEEVVSDASAPSAEEIA